MGVLGKDYLDIFRSRTLVKIHFGEMCYWVEYEPAPLPYGATLTELLNYNAGTSRPQPRSVLEIYLSAGEDILPIQERYIWFLEELFRDSIPEKKKARGKNLWPNRYAQNFWTHM